MNHLFNPKTIARHLTNTAKPTEEQAAHLAAWAELIRSGRIMDHKETALHGDFKARIIEGVLGYRSAVDNAEHTVTSEQAILKGSVDLALGHFGPDKSQIIAPLELKGAKTKDLDAIMPGRAKSPVQQAWEYATNAPGVKWVLVSNYTELRVYGFGEGTEACERFDLARLTESEEYARFSLLLSADNLLSGRTQALLAESRQEDKDITDDLYRDYKALRGELIHAIRKQAPDVPALDAISAAQTILDRLLFTAFAEDTGLLPKRILEKAFEHADPFNPRPVWENFKGLFAAIDKGNKQLDVPPYNGGLFAHDPVADTVTIPDAVCKGFKKIGDYDFASQVSVTVLGHIFEQSIADVERLQAEARGEEVEPEKKTGTTGRRKRDGVVYTPDYIARFIVEQTLGTHLREIFAGVIAHHAQKGASADAYEAIKWKRKTAELEAWETYRDRLKTLRIVDPACGSGVFLVTAFDYMKAELIRVNDKIAELKGGVRSLFDPDSEILTNNLFGVDVNAESIEIAKLSLWVKTAQRGKPLDSLDRNLKVGDSLIEDSSFAYLSHGFTWATAFPNVFAEGGFDIVLGNPPYVRQELLSSMKPYLLSRFEVYHGVADLYCYFFERGLRLLKFGGRLGYISSSTFFKTSSGKPLRDFLRGKTTLETVVDFGDLQIFEGVTTYPVILTMRRDAPDKKHNLRFWNIEELPEANFPASFEIHAEPYAQAALSSGSWDLENPALYALKSKVINRKRSLCTIYGKPFRGVTTGRNDAFVVDQKIRDELASKDASSNDILKPWIEGKDLKRWHQDWRNQWIILARQGLNLAEYPAIVEYLSAHREKLEPRPQNWKPSQPDEKWPGRKPGTYYWSEIQDKTAYWKKFSSEKIVSTKISARPTFSVDRSCSILSNTAYMIDAGADNEFVTSLLNSNLAFFYFKSIFVVKSGGFFEIQPDGLGNFPIPHANSEQKTEISRLARAAQLGSEKRLTLQQSLTRRIPDLAPPGSDPKLTTKLKEWWELPDFAAFRAEVKKVLKADIPLAERSAWEDWIARDKAEIARLTAEIKANEAQINAIVYELFELTAEEITLLENNLT
jgi:type I restriction-modification system DNA methylase subunit